MWKVLGFASGVGSNLGFVLTETFCHVPGLGGHTERSLWKQGCKDWGTYLADPAAFTVGSVGEATVVRCLEQSVEALEVGDFGYFRQGLGARETWRAWPEFRKKAVYLDIETDGGRFGDSVTTIGLYDGHRFTCLVKGQDLDEFPEIISQYGMIVTFFGTGFDLPMLMKRFRGIRFEQLHLDLCHTLKRVGFKGGLKKIEKQLGIARGDDTDGLSGLDAIRLWREYQYGREESLATLIEYNKEDVVNLEVLAEIAYGKLREDLMVGAGVV